MGKLLKPRGLKGELRFLVFNEVDSVLETGMKVWVELENGQYSNHLIELLEISREKSRIKFSGCNRREDAHQLAVQTVLGAAKIIDQNREHPAVWKSRVTTPAGTTAAGLFELEQGKFRSIINAAVIAATERAQELAYV